MATIEFNHRNDVYRAIDDFDRLEMYGKRIRIEKYREKVCWRDYLNLI